MRGAADGPFAAGALLGVAVLAAYANALGASFQFDDWAVIVDERRVASLSAFWASMPGIRPVLKLSYALGNEAGIGAFGFHAVNVAIHLGAALLVFALLRRLLRTGAAAPDAPAGLDALASSDAPAAGVSRAAPRAAWREELGPLVGALVFALHPAQTEAVTYVSGRSTSLAALFALACALCWLRARSGEGGRAARILSPLFFALALATKEYVAVLPFALLLLERVDPAVQARPRRRFGALRALAPHLALLCAALALAAAGGTYSRLAATSLALRGPLDNFAAQLDGLAYLLRQIVFWPALNADPALSAPGWTTVRLLAALSLAALVALALAALRRRPRLAFAPLWFLLWLAPTNSLLARLDVVNDRQLYLPLFAVAYLVALLAQRALAAVRAEATGRVRAAAPRVLLAAVAALLLAMGWGTCRRNLVYADEVVFWRDVAAKSPSNGRAFNNLGYALALAGRAAEAETAFRAALARDPNDVAAAVNLRLLREGALLPRAGGRAVPRR
ncbi:hypothetical protein LLG88_10815 [bacterium]|nr:hypothetical protein [bacterium]